MMILPTSEDRAHTGIPWLLWAIIAANTLLWLADAAAGGRLVLDWGFRPAAPDIGSALASAFLHAGFLHLFGNMLFLYTFGNAVEDSLGWLNFALVYLLTHAFAILAHAMTHPNDFTVVVGASGAVSGIMGVYGFLYSKRPITLHFFIGPFRMGKATIAALAAVLMWLGMDLVLALLTGGGQVGGTAYWAHIGGAAMGFIMGMMYDGLGLARQYSKNKRP
jgi:membrane associated rhomboid family serine protease